MSVCKERLVSSLRGTWPPSNDWDSVITSNTGRWRPARDEWPRRTCSGSRPSSIRRRSSGRPSSERISVSLDRADHFDEVIVEGSLEKLNFVACYCVKGEVRAVATMARDPVAVAAGELLRLGKMPSAAQLREGTVSTASFVSLLQQA